MTARAHLQAIGDPEIGAAEFLNALYGRDAPGHLVLWRKADRRSRWIHANRLDEAASAGRGQRDLYFGVALQDQRIALRRAGTADPARVRGQAESTIALPGLWADLDIRGPAHKSSTLPRSIDEVLRFLDDFPLQPTAIVHSGHGAQVWWLFSELWTFDGVGDRVQAADLSRRFHTTLQGRADQHGWRFDNTSDLARVLRLPETINAKLTDPKPVRVLDWRPEQRYCPADFEAILSGEYRHGASSSPAVDTSAVLSGVVQGQRDVELFRFACKLRHADVPREAADELVLRAASQCTPPFPEREALAKAASAYKYPAGGGDPKRSELPPCTFPEIQPLPKDSVDPPELPAELLPAPLRDWLGDIAHRLQVPLEMAAAPAVVALASVVGRRMGVHPKAHDDWLVVPNLWGAIVARPGALKSPTLAEAVKPIRHLASREQERIADLRARDVPHLESLRAKEAALKNHLRRAHEGRGKQTVDSLVVALRETRGEVLALEATLDGRRYLLNDATVEKVGELLAKNRQGLLLERDELAGWLSSLERDDRKGDREFYLEAWNGTGGYTYDRIGRGTIEVPALCLSIIGGMQPAKLKTFVSAALSGGYAADGLLQRFQLLVWPTMHRGWRIVDQAPAQRARDRVLRIFEVLDVLPVPEKNSDRRVPARRFAADAQQLYYEWLEKLELGLRGSEADSRPAFESHLAKYRSLMPSLALLFALVEEADCGSVDIEAPVDLKAAQIAADWCGYLELHARKVYAAELSRDIEAARVLAKRIRDGEVVDGMTIRDLRRRRWSGLRAEDAVSKGLEVLESIGWVLQETQKTRGRPSRVLRVNPRVLQEDGP